MSGLPVWEVCEGRVAASTETKLEHFIYNNEPAGQDLSAEFRKELEDVLAETRAEMLAALRAASDELERQINDPDATAEEGFPVAERIRAAIAKVEAVA